MFTVEEAASVLRVPRLDAPAAFSDADAGQVLGLFRTVLSSTVEVTIGVGAVALSGQAQSVTADASVSIGTQAVSITQNHQAGVSASVTAEPAAQAVTLAGQQPAISASILLNGPQLVSLFGWLQTVAASVTAQPGAQTVTLPGLPPAVAASSTIAIGAQSIAITGRQPSITAGADVSIGVQAVTITGLQPSVDFGVGVAIGVQSLSITGYTPTVTATGPSASYTPFVYPHPSRGVDTGDAIVPIGVGTVALTGAAPAIEANSSVAIGAGSVVALTGNAPSVDVITIVLIGVGSIAIVGAAPNIAADASIAIGAAAVAITGYAPLVDTGQQIDTTVAIGAGAVTVTGLAQGRYTDSNIYIASVDVLLEGKQPGVLVPGLDVVIAVGVGTLTINGQAPGIVSFATSAAWPTVPFNRGPIDYRQVRVSSHRRPSAKGSTSECANCKTFVRTEDLRQRQRDGLLVCPACDFTLPIRRMLVTSESQSPRKTQPIKTQPPPAGPSPPLLQPIDMRQKPNYRNSA